MKEVCTHRHVKYMCIQKVPIFNHLEHEEMLQVLGTSTQKKYKKGEIIYHHGDVSEYLYIVHKGRVKIYQLFESGKEQLLRILEQGEFMGEFALFTDNELEGYAEALEETEICAIHKDDMQALMQTHPMISLKILKEFSMRLEKMEALVGQLSNQEAESRIAHYVITLAEEKNTNHIVLPMSKKDLASYLGTTQETISRRLSKFQANGWIEKKGQREINIIDMESLTRVAENT